MLLEPRGLTLGSAAGHCTGTNRFERRRAQTRYISTNSANPFAGPWASDNLSYWPQTARDFHQPPSTRAYRAYPSRTGLGWPGSVAHSMRIASVTRIFISVTTLTCFQVFSCLPMPPRTTIRCPLPNVPCWPFQERNQPASSSQPRIQVWRPLFPRAAPGAPLHKLGTCRACSSRPRSRHESIAFAVTRSRRRPQRSAAGLRRR